MNLHRMLLERAANNNPLRIGLIGAGKFGAMYLSQIPTHAGHPSARHRRPVAAAGAARTWRGSAGSPRSRRAASFAEARKHGNTFLTDDWKALVSHPEIDVVVEVDRRSDRRRRARAGSLPERQERGHGDGRGRRLLRPAAGAPRRRSRRDLQPRLRRPAGADLRTGGLGARVRLLGDGGRPRPQVAAALRAVDARDGVEILGPQRGAGQARRPESQDVQLLPRRLQARDREHGGFQRHRPDAGARRSGLPAVLGRGPAVRDAPRLRRRAAPSQGPGRGGIVAGEGRPRDSLRDPQGRVGRVRGQHRIPEELLRGVHAAAPIRRGGTP